MKVRNLIEWAKRFACFLIQGSGFQVKQVDTRVNKLAKEMFHFGRIFGLE